MTIRNNLRDNSTLFTILFVFAVIVWLRFFYPPDNALSWDVFGYYLYLPAKFIYHDLGLLNQDWLNKLVVNYQTTGTLYQAYIGPSGQWVLKYSMGMAILYSPFFLISHLIAGFLGYPADGLSLPYQYGIAIGGLFYTLFGLIYFRKILLKFFRDRIIVTFVLILTFFGTNVINQATAGNLLSHNYLFTLFAAFVWYTIKWHKNYKFRFMILMAFISGLMTLIRPNEVVCLLIPLLWGVKNKESIINKVRLFNRKKLQIFIGIICFIIVLLPQLYYWKKHTGNYFFYSYPNPGEGLDFFSPHLGNFLFSFRKGWIIYTPMLLFYLAGLYFLYKKRKEVFIPVAVYLIISVYLISSWTCWWYAGGCYSQRAVLSLYVLLSIGLGFFLEKISKLKSFKKLLVYSLLILLVALNLFQYWQFQSGILKNDCMTRKYYFAIFGKAKIPENAPQLLLEDRSVTGIEKFNNEEGFNKKIVGAYTFVHPNTSNPERYVKDPEDTIKYCLVLDSTFIYSPGLTMKYKNITGEYYAWIRASIEVRYSKNYKDNWPVLVLTFEHNGGNYKYFAGDLFCNEDEKGDWKKISFDYMTPEVRSIEDPLKVYVWHRGKNPVLFKNLFIEAYEPVIN